MKQRQHSSKKRPPGGFNLQYDKLAEKMILTILDKETMLPMIIKMPDVQPKELLLTSLGKLHLQ